MDISLLKKYFYEHLISSCVTLMLGFGGSVLLFYYANIGYMPVLDWPSSSLLLGAVAATSFLSIGCLTVLFVIPGLVWRIGMKESGAARLWKDDEGRESFRSVGGWFTLPVLTAAISIGLLPSYPCVGACLGVALIIGIAAALSWKLKLGVRALLKEFAPFFLITVATACLISFPLITIIVLTVRAGNTLMLPPVMTGIIAAMFIMFVNTGSAMTPGPNLKSRVWIPVLGFTVLFIVLTLYSLWHRIPQFAVETYRFGNIHTKQMIFRSTACDYLTAMTDGPFDNPAADRKTCSATGITILNRLGTEAYLEYKGCGPAQRFTVSNADIATWTVYAPPDLSPQQTVDKSFEMTAPPNPNAQPTYCSDKKVAAPTDPTRH